MIRSKTSSKKGAVKESGAWTVHDKIYEIRGKLTLKRRDQEAYYVFSQQQIKDNETLIKNLRAEIHEKRILRKHSLNADEHVIKEGFQDHRESQLAMQRYTVGKAMREKNEHVFDKVSALNAARHERNRRLRKIKDLSVVLRDVKLASRNNFEDESNQRLRVLMTSIDKMTMKYNSACFIQRTYLQILRHLERESLTLPGRLRMLESSIQRNNNELDGDLYQIQLDARKTYANTRQVKEKMEEHIMREKRERDRKLADVRKLFKKINQKEEKEYKPKKRALHKSEKHAESSANFWGKIRYFWSRKRTMDKLLEQVSVGHPKDIAPCFQNQINRGKHLSLMVKNLSEKKLASLEALGVQQEASDHASKSYNQLLEETIEKKRELHDVIDEKMKDVQAKSTQVDSLETLLRNVVAAMRMIHQKATTCDWIAKRIKNRHGSQHQIKAVISSGDVTRIDMEDLEAVLVSCGEKLAELKLLVDYIYLNNEEMLHDFNTDDGQELLVTATASAPFNTRVCIVDEDDFLMSEDFFGDDDDTNDQYLSRDAVKNVMLQYTEQQTARRKKRRTKKT